MKNSTAIIGGGPAGLMAAEVLIQRGINVDVYDSMPSLGRKFLMAGKSGLNLTHSEPLEKFTARYGKRAELVQQWLKDFTPEDIRAWASGLGVETFIGTSGRVFPVGMKASPLLRAWLKRLEESGVRFHRKHKWIGFQSMEALDSKSGDFALRLKFKTPEGEKIIQADAVILALGGGSWKKTGSDATWIPILNQLGVEVAPLKPANCGFDAAWSDHLRAKFDGAPLKSVILSFKDFHQQGEFIITKDGVEGSLIYAASALIRDEIEVSRKAIIHLDLLPDRTMEQVTGKLSAPRGSRSMASHLEKTLGLKGVKVALLHEFVPKENFGDAKKLATFIKALPVPLIAPSPLDEAISSAGGVKFEELDESLMVKKIPGVFCAGEMLDWEAPTGGYLLTACFASGRVAAQGTASWFKGASGHPLIR